SSPKMQERVAWLPPLRRQGRAGEGLPRITKYPPKGIGPMEDIWKHARALCNDATDAERHLWQYLRGRRLAGFKFRRQYPIAGVSPISPASTQGWLSNLMAASMWSALWKMPSAAAGS